MMANNFESTWVGECPAAPDFHSSMTFVGSLPKGVVHVLEVALTRPGKPFLHILMKLALVAFESQHIISALLNDSAGNVLLATHRVNAHNTTGHIQALEQFWTSRNLVGFVIDLTLSQ